MTKKILPLGNRVLIRRQKAETSKGGILLPDSATDKKTTRGEVLAVGPGKRDDNGTLEPMSVKIDDQVLFGQYAGTPVSTDEASDEELLIMSEDEILGVL